MTEQLTIAGRQFHSRLIVGTGKYRSFQEMARAHQASGADMVTVAVRRVNLSDRSKESLLDYIDRKKELLKTAAGKFVAPAPIENTLKTSPYISNAIVVGDTRKFVSVLIVPNFANIEAAARKAGQDFATPTQMTGDPWVRDLLSSEIERLTASLAQYEKPKRFALLEQDFTYAGGELTYTMKMKRRVIEQRYQDVIARLYADVEEPRPHHLA